MNTFRKKIIIHSILTLLFFSECKKQSIFNSHKPLIGTIINLSLIAPNEEIAQRAANEVFNKIIHIENIMSPYKSQSDIFRINNEAWEKPVIISSETFSLIQTSLEISSITDGNFDITFESISHLWNFSKNPFIPPQNREVLRNLPLVNYKWIQPDKKHSSIKIQKKGVKIGLGAIAKGYSIKKGIECLKSIGIRDAILEAGGDLQVIGKKFNKPWHIGLKHPRKNNIILTINLNNMDSIATSGDYERCAFHNNIRYHHIIDPKTGYPSKGFASVSVLSKNPVYADSLATALFVMNNSEVKNFIKKKKDIFIILIDAEMKVLASKELKQRIKPIDSIEIEWL